LTLRSSNFFTTKSLRRMDSRSS